MLDVNKRPLHASRHPSLLPLRMALTVAASAAPASPPHMDANEQRALQLIQKVKASYKKQPFVLDFQDIPSPHDSGIKWRSSATVYADQL